MHRSLLPLFPLVPRNPFLPQIRCLFYHSCTVAVNSGNTSIPSLSSLLSKRINIMSRRGLKVLIYNKYNNNSACTTNITVYAINFRFMNLWWNFNLFELNNLISYSFMLMIVFSNSIIKNLKQNTITYLYSYKDDKSISDRMHPNSNL